MYYFKDLLYSYTLLFSVNPVSYHIFLLIWLTFTNYFLLYVKCNLFYFI